MTDRHAADVLLAQSGTGRKGWEMEEESESKRKQRAGDKDRPRQKEKSRRERLKAEEEEEGGEDRTSETGGDVKQVKPCRPGLSHANPEILR